MNALKVFWRFTRPHTILGSAASIIGLYIIATGQYMYWSPVFWFALVAALACNVFITGYNQLIDVKLDKINKPGLPLAAGEMSIKNARIIIWLALFIALAAALFVSLFLLGLIVIISIIGFFYSWKKIYLKKKHTFAALAITLVRGLLVNLGFYLVFAGQGPDLTIIPPEIWLLSGFIFLFSLGIAWFKDIPDIIGDKQEQVGTLAVNLGAIRAFNFGIYAVGTAYTLCAFSPFFMDFSFVNTTVISFGHIIYGFFFLAMAYRVEPNSKESVGDFYRVFWGLFLAEYVVFALAAVV
jgi:homogentisate phytyltransferase/homogentisate geranylgeranyltransferase